MTQVVEIKAFVPARDFDLSVSFYHDLGFTLASSDGRIAYFHHGDASFLLQRFYVKEHAANFMMHLLVEDVEVWWAQVRTRDLAGKYGVKVGPVELRPWGMKDFVLADPTGVLWRIAQNVDRV